jgi:hypothetical protein
MYTRKFDEASSPKKGNVPDLLMDGKRRYSFAKLSNPSRP